jgi:hypothetical protein
MVSKAASASREQGDRPLVFDREYLEKKIDQAMGTLVNSRDRWWRILPAYVRKPLTRSREGQETCERIHESVLRRYKWAGDKSFQPFPYDPMNVKQFLDRGDDKLIAELSEFERSCRHWR